MFELCSVAGEAGWGWLSRGWGLLRDQLALAKVLGVRWVG